MLSTYNRRTSKRQHSVIEIREIQVVGSENKALSHEAELSQSDGASELSFSLLQNGRCHNGEGHHLAAPRERVQRVTQYLFDGR